MTVHEVGDRIVLKHALVFDGVSPDVRESDILICEGVIAEIGNERLVARGARSIDLKGLVLMPGLIDAHVHAYFPQIDATAVDRMPMTLVAHHARVMLENSLARGFTSVRDCGGADIGLYLATEGGLIKGPRVFFCGKGLSQTGGHGDKRHPHQIEYCACSDHGVGDAGFKGHRTRVVDGADSLRVAVREELRHGAHFIKIHASGGVVSLGDPIDRAQYSADEIRAVVDEVERHGKYVTAHCHPDAAIRRCIELGVHGIEHATLISSETAELAAKAGTAVVPTLAIASALKAHGREYGIPPTYLQKLAALEPRALNSVEILSRAGVDIGFGTDLIGPLERYQCIEFELRREVFSPFEILRSATSVNARILRQELTLGRVAVGFTADLIAVRGDPLRDVSVFSNDGHNVALIIKGGTVLKDDLHHVA